MESIIIILGVFGFLLWTIRSPPNPAIVSTMSLSPVDPNSYARTDLVKTTHVHLEVEVDFQNQILDGHVILSLEKLDQAANSVILDARSLTITKVTEEASGQVLDFEYGSPSGFGEKLEIQLPSSVAPEFRIRVDYRTSPKSSALQWLTPNQTAGKQHPYVFSQCQAIHCRSMLPCQVQKEMNVQNI